MITVENTTRSYSGRRGCMCGCNGNYSDKIRTRKLAITQLTKDPDVQLHHWNNATEGCIFVDTDTRTRALYLTAQGVAEAKAMGIKTLEEAA